MWKWECEEKPKGVIVMVHGALEHHGRYGWLIEMWRQNGFHVVMGDLPGQGMTSRAKRGHISSFKEYTNELSDWVQAAYQFNVPVFLLGHSMGALVITRYLQEEKPEIAGVIMSSPLFKMKHVPPKHLNVLTHGLNSMTPSLKFDSGITSEMATRNEEIWAFDAEDSLFVRKVSVRWYREIVQAIKIATAGPGEVPDIPHLIMQAGEDRITDGSTARSFAKKLELSELQYKEWPGLYHEIFNEPEREDVFQYALDFVHNRLRSLGFIMEK
ncbi:alpha/beta hydrolase [Domibacillus indicus]|uniref:alpha/beta hydrolase n=1 Tax=Domibacillus TaxID=1433999 RepID=UPI001F56539A|nr:MULTISPECIES: alpha/beta hydrolase [Domibacillus]MCI2254266.1 alpha/beta hydrolase [Domibacillus sp. PGB-M46]MCM3787019.1 alpha/beta hydrolase [Domibacillus indicus]